MGNSGTAVLLHAPCSPVGMRVRRRVFKGSGPVKPIRGQIHPLNGVVQNLRELRRGFTARVDWRLLHPLP